MGHRIDKIALTPVQVDVLNDPNQIEDHTGEQTGKENSADTEQNPVNRRAAGFFRVHRAKDVQQDPANGQPHKHDDHQNRDQNRPLEAFSFEHRVVAP